MKAFEGKPGIASEEEEQSNVDLVRNLRMSESCHPKTTPYLKLNLNGAPQVSIVCDYLASQHRLCKNPMTTCPEFDLLVPHKCPDPRPKNSAPWNITSR